MALAPARSALARSNATRSDYPIEQGQRLLLYALSNVARSAATRSNYIGSGSFASIGGIQVGCGRPAGGARIVPDTLVITDILNDVPNTAHFSMQGGVPLEGQSVIITLGSQNNSRREFAGWILNRTQRYIGTPANAIFDLNCIDWTWGLNRHKVSTRFQTATIQTIIATLVNTYAAGYTVDVAADVAGLTLPDISFTNQDLTTCLTQTCKRCGASWLCDEFKVVRVFTVDTTGTAPTPINAVHPSLMAFSASYDLSQVLTRVLSEGGGGAALAAVIGAGETILPIDTAVWYETPSGRVAVGTQRLRYTGVFLGGGGSLVGPGAAPVVAPQGTLASGSGVPDGAHDYAVSFVTAGGESLVGPRLTLSVGKVLAPATAPTVGTAQPGPGPNPGSHWYAVSFVTAAGETPPGPNMGGVSTVSAPPATGPTAGAATPGGSIDAGSHDYAVSFVTAYGETTPGPIGGSVTTSGGTPIPAPTGSPTPGAATVGGNIDPGTHDYAATFVTDYGETLAGPIGPTVATTGGTPIAAPGSACSAAAPTSGGSLDPGTHSYNVTFVTSFGETTAGPTSNTVTTTADSTLASPSLGISLGLNFNGNLHEFSTYTYAVSYVTAAGETAVGPSNSIGTGSNTAGFTATLSGIQVGPAGTTARRIYRTAANGGQLRLLTTLNDNIAGGYLDNVADGNLGGAPPLSSPTVTGTRTVSLSAIVTGPAGTTARRLYRTSGGAGARLLAQISNNTTTTYTDTAANASLGAAPPSSSPSATGSQTVPLSTIPTGPAGTTARNLYRRSGGAGLRLLATLANNSTTTYTDSASNALLGAAPPTTAPLGGSSATVPLTAIEKGPSGTTARKIYRRSGGAGLRLLTTIANNSSTTYTDTTANASLGAAPLATSTAAVSQLPLTAIPTGGPLVTARKLWGTAADVGTLQFIATIPDNTTTTYLVTTPDASLGAVAPTVNTAAANQVQLSGIPTGVAAVTARKVYRTAANLTPLKLLATLADNATTTYLDALADASLGAAPPATDASGLQQPAGIVLAGSTTLIMAGTSAMAAAGWAVIGNGEQVIRYTGLTANSLTGIPASGNGAITASIAYNSTVTAAPQLSGIPTVGDGAIVTTIVRGDEVNLLVQEDDLDAQAALKAKITDDPYFDGVQEDYLSDNRLSAPEAHARARAWLDLRKQVVVTVHGTTRDINTRSGQLLHVNLGPFNLVADFLIQQVTEHTFLPALMPTFDFEASSLRFTFEDWLRIVKRDSATT